MMREHPILFSTDMIRAILDGRKTQTRRIMKPQPTTCQCDKPDWQAKRIDWVGDKLEGRHGWFCHTCGTGLMLADEWSGRGRLCPYGQTGDTLWVRETHYRYGRWVKNGLTKTGRQKWRFKPINEGIRYLDDTPVVVTKDKRYVGWWKRSPLFMPKKYARTWLEITGVGVERVQEISPHELSTTSLLAEGLPKHNFGIDHTTSLERYVLLEDFIALWDSINAKHPWASNPWCWCISFKLV